MFPSFADGSEQSTYQRKSSRIRVSLNQSTERRLILHCLMPTAHLYRKLAFVILNQEQDPPAWLGKTHCFYGKGWCLPALFDSYLPPSSHLNMVRLFFPHTCSFEGKVTDLSWIWPRAKPRKETGNLLIGRPQHSNYTMGLLSVKTHTAW